MRPTLGNGLWKNRQAQIHWLVFRFVTLYVRQLRAGRDAARTLARGLSADDAVEMGKSPYVEKSGKELVGKGPSASYIVEQGSI